MTIRTILFGTGIVIVSFVGALLLMNVLWPAAPTQTALPQAPAVAAVPPLQPLAGTSTVLAPVAIAMSAIGAALEAKAPKNLAGKAKNPVSQLLSNTTLNITMTRGPLTVSGQSNTLVITTPLSGTLEALGTIGAGANALGGAIGSILGNINSGIGQQVQNLAGKAFDQKAQIQGNATATARPTISSNWRLTPNLSAQANIVDVALPIAGIKLSVANEVKPFVDSAVSQQTGALEARLSNDPFIENAARKEWTQLCRSIPLGAAAQGMPNLWLEIQPTNAIAAQPQIEANAVTLLVGVQAQTRIVPNQTTPNCPFPQQLNIVPQANDGTLSIAVPIDIPFTEVNKLLEAQIAGKTYPEDGSGEFATTIKQATVTPSGDRLLISLLVNVKKRGLFSFGANATVYVWGQPVLDQQNQILRLTNVTLDVQSTGLLGAAAKAATPLLQKALADKAVIDLKPFAADAEKRIATAVSGLTAQGGGVTANVAINDLRLTGIAYDAKALRIIANADGTVNVAVSSLTMQ